MSTHPRDLGGHGDAASKHDGGRVVTDDATLLARFESLALPPSEFGHREHVRVAFAMLRDTQDFAAAAHRFRTALLRFATAAGAAAKYHETLTWAYLALVHERMAERAYP